jgi:hypothetical protein
MAFRLRAAQGKLKIEHSIIEGVRPVLDALSQYPEIALIVPGVIRKVRDAKGKVKMHITVPTQNGWKLIALSAGARQEIFISTQWSQEDLLKALQACGAICD